MASKVTWFSIFVSCLWIMSLRKSCAVDLRYRVYCLIGDGESAEGAIWEALHLASHYHLDNLVAVFDINRLGQSEATSLQHEMDVYQRRLTAFGLVTFMPVTFKNLICFGRNFAKHCGLIAF